MEQTSLFMRLLFIPTQTFLIHDVFFQIARS